MQTERELLKLTALDNAEGLADDAKALNRALVRIRIAMRKSISHLDQVASELEQQTE